MAYEGPIDLDRGVMICTHPSGMDIFMYLDDPGKYFDAHANPLPSSFAKAAGFPTETMEKKRKLQDDMRLVREKMEATLQIRDTVEVYKEEGDLRILHYPDNGMATLERAGEKLLPKPMPLSLVVTWFQDLVAEDKARKNEEGSAAEQVNASSTQAAPTPPQPSPAPAAAPGAGKKA